MASPRRMSHPARFHLPRGVLATAGALAFLAGAAPAARAQDQVPSEPQLSATPRPGWEIVVPAGTLVPTGAHRDEIARGGLNALQVSWVRPPTLALTGTVGWARSRDVIGPAHPQLDVFLFDVGAEARAPRRITWGRVTLSPFAGVGAGTQAFNPRGPDPMKWVPAAYGSAGAELGAWRFRVRLEARDYVSGFDATRNDVVMMAGLRIASAR